MESCVKDTECISFMEMMVCKAVLKLRNAYLLRRSWYENLC